MRRFSGGRRNYLIVAATAVVVIGILAVTVSAGWINGSGTEQKQPSRVAKPMLAHQPERAQAAAATSIPQAPPASPAATPAAATPAGTPTPPPLPALAALLPTDNDVPSGLVPSSDEKRDAAQVADQLTGGSGDAAASATAQQDLKSWGWSEAIEREFRPPQESEATAAPQGQQGVAADGIRWMWVTIYRFDTPTGASKAFDQLTAQAKTLSGMNETATGKIGDQTLGLARKGNDGLFHLWFRIGTDVVWIGGTSTKAFPRADIEATAQTIWARDGVQQFGTAPAATPVAAKSVVKVGDTATVSDGSNVRQSAAADATVVTTVGPGDEIKVTDPSVVADGHAWWPITVPGTGETGYIASSLVVPAGP